jgi:hypothetical protein
MGIAPFKYVRSSKEINIKMSQIQWKRGQFLTFFAKMKIRIGSHAGSEPVDILAEDEFEYDGTICKYAGREFPQPNIRAAIREGWATLNNQSGDLPVANIPSRDMAAVISKNTDLSRVQRSGRKVLEKDSLDEETVLNVADRSNVRDNNTGRGHLDSAHNMRKSSTAGTFRGLEVQASELDSQEGTIISSIKSPTKLKLDVIANPNAVRDIEQRSSDNGFGMCDVPRSTTREGIEIVSNVGNVSKQVQNEYADDGEVVGKVRNANFPTKSVEGITISDTSSAPQRRMETEKPPIVNSKLVKIDSNSDNVSPKLKMALRIYPNFPLDWNFYAKSQDKLSRIKQLGADSDLLTALYAVESSGMKTTLKQEYPKHFS